MNRIITLILCFVLFVTPQVFALESKETLTLDSSFLEVSRESVSLDVVKYEEKLIDKQLVYDTEIKSLNTELKLTNVKEATLKPTIEIRDGVSELRGSDIVKINNIELENAEILLKKYYPDDLRLLYSKDGLNYTEANITYLQNETHMWFNTTHFSEFTAAFPDIWVFVDSAFQQLQIDLDNFADIDAGDLSFISHIVDESSSANTGYETIAVCRDVEWVVDFLGRICAYSGHLYLFDVGNNNASINYIDNTGGVRFTLYDPSPYSVLDTASAIYIYYIVEYEEPEISLPLPVIGETTATLRGEVDFNHARRTGAFYDYDPDYDTYTAVKEARFRYKEASEGWLDAEITSWKSVSNQAVFSEAVTGLTPNTNYNVEIDFKYWDVTTNDVEIITSGFSFTTESDVPVPTVETVSATSVADTTATIRGLPDFDGYTEAIRGRLCYRAGTSGEFDCNAFASVTDATIFTRALTGLTAETSYQFYAEIDWDSASFNDVGDILTFTTSATGGGTSEFQDNNIWWISAYSGTIQDDSDTITFTNNGVSVTNDRMIFDGTNDYLNFGTNARTSDNTGTILMRLKFNSVFSSDGSATLWNVRGTTNTNPILSIRLFKDASVNNRILYTFRNNAGTGTKLLFGSTTISSDTEYLIEVSSDGSDIRISINGNEETLSEYVGTNAGEWLDEIGTTYTTRVVSGVDANDLSTLPLDADVCYIAYYSSQLSLADVEDIYNLGCTFNPYIVEETNPSASMLATQNITSESALIRMLPDFGDYESSVAGYFQYIKSSDAIGDWTNASNWTWSRFPALEDTVLTDATIYSETLSGLDWNTEYRVQAVVVWATGEFYSEDVTFTTLNATLQEIETLTPTSVSFDRATLRGNVESLGDMPQLEGFFIIKGSYLLNDNLIINDAGVVAGDIFIDTTGIKTHTFGGSSFIELIENTTYCYIFITSYPEVEGTQVQGNETCFTTLFEGDPILSTFEAVGIKRTEAEISGKIEDFGDYESLSVYFKYWNFGNETNLTTTPETYTDTGSEFATFHTEIIEDLLINTTYYYEIITLIGDREVSGGINTFNTKSLLDFLAPEINLVYFNVGFDDLEVALDVNLEDANISDLYFYLFDSTENLEDTYVMLDVNESGTYIHTFTNLTSERLYYYQAELFYYNPETEEADSDITGREPAITLNIFQTPIQVCIIDRFCLDIKDRYLFMMLLIVGITLLGLGFSVGSSFSNNGAETILIYAVTGLAVIGSIWLYMAQIMSGWIFIYVILGVVLISIYYVMQSIKGGSVYG